MLNAGVFVRSSDSLRSCICVRIRIAACSQVHFNLLDLLLKARVILRLVHRAGRFITHRLELPGLVTIVWRLLTVIIIIVLTTAKLNRPLRSAGIHIQSASHLIIHLVLSARFISLVGEIWLLHKLLRVVHLYLKHVLLSCVGIGHLHSLLALIRWNFVNFELILALSKVLATCIISARYLTVDGCLALTNRCDTSTVGLFTSLLIVDRFNSYYLGCGKTTLERSCLLGLLNFI
jgi:hypothetical protein